MKIFPIVMFACTLAFQFVFLDSWNGKLPAVVPVKEDVSTKEGVVKTSTYALFLKKVIRLETEKKSESNYKTETTCMAKRCIANGQCCDGYVCGNIMGLGTGACKKIKGYKKGEVCYHDADCSPNLLCREKDDYRVCAKSDRPKSRYAPCDTSGECNMDKMECCQYKFYEGIFTPLKICALYTNPKTCIGPVYDADHKYGSKDNKYGYKRVNVGYKHGNNDYKRRDDDYKHGNGDNKRVNVGYKIGNDDYKRVNVGYKGGNDYYKHVIVGYEHGNGDYKHVNIGNKRGNDDYKRIINFGYKRGNDGYKRIINVDYKHCSYYYKRIINVGYKRGINGYKRIISVIYKRGNQYYKHVNVGYIKPGSVYYKRGNYGYMRGDAGYMAGDAGYKFMRG